MIVATIIGYKMQYKKFGKPYAGWLNVIDHHLKRFKPRDYYCPFCDMVFCNKNNYWQHRKKCEPKEIKKEQPEQLILFGGDDDGNNG